MLKAPFTTDQVAALNRWQACGWVHPFTCQCGKNLVATTVGWVCDCGYTQDWAHDMMLDPDKLNPWIEKGGERG